MIRTKNLMTCLLLAVLVLTSQVCSAEGFFSNISTFFKERSEIKTHSKSILIGVRDLFKERKSISSFTQSSSSLISAYRAIKDKKANISLLMNIATSISSLVKEYSNLAPKMSAVYSKIKPDINYFSKLKGDEGDMTVKSGNQSFVLRSLTDSRIGKLSGAAGWARIYDSVTSNPINIFKWGKLSDEYQYGKAEANYVLKCTQIAFEAESFYNAAQSQIQGILGIQKEIQGILNGDLSALLGINNTIQNITNSAQGVEDFGGLINTAVSRLGQRANELSLIQEQYVAANNSYTQKYAAKTTTGKISTTGGIQSGSTYDNTPGISNTSGTTGKLSLQQAYDAYQKAYKNYTSIVSNSRSTEADKTNAVSELNAARTQYENAKAAAGQK